MRYKYKVMTLKVNYEINQTDDIKVIIIISQNYDKKS